MRRIERARPTSYRKFFISNGRMAGFVDSYALKRYDDTQKISASGVNVSL